MLIRIAVALVLATACTKGESHPGEPVAVAQAQTPAKEHPGATPSKAGEHPGEHPGKEHPGAGASPEQTAADVRAAVDAYIKAKASAAGEFALDDPAIGGRWTVKLDKIHPVRMIDESHWFVCADFAGTLDARGKKRGATADFDFFVNRAGGGWQVVKADVHKQDGKVRDRPYRCASNAEVLATTPGPCPLDGTPMVPVKAAAPSADTRVAIRVDGSGYHPSTVKAKAGESLTLVFTRTTDQTCGREVVVPSENIRRDLPLKQPVEVTVVPKATGTIAFTCGMNMYRGSIVVQ